MNYKELFGKFGFDLKKLRLNLKFLSADFTPLHSDEEAAWEMYVYMITTVLTQRLEPEQGVEEAALTSVHKLFQNTRDILIRRGRNAQRFSKIAVVILNQIVRPFTAEWHKKSVKGAFKEPAECENFRSELGKLQDELKKYSALLAYMSNVEDITTIQVEEDECYGEREFIAIKLIRRGRPLQEIHEDTDVSLQRLEQLAIGNRSTEQNFLR